MPLFAGTQGCTLSNVDSQSGLVGCTVDSTGIWETCNVPYCTDLPYCDSDLRKLAQHIDVPATAQVCNALPQGSSFSVLLLICFLATEAVQYERI